MHATGRWLAGLVVSGIFAVSVAAHAQSAKPEPKPSPSPAAAGNSQTSQLPAGVDSGVPGTGQTPSLSGPGTNDKTRRSLLRRRDAAASAPVNDSAAAQAAARPEPLPPKAASSPVPSRKPSPPSR